MPAPAEVVPVGAHVRVSGGLGRGGLAYAEQVGAEAVQVFVSNPRGWAQAAGDPAADEAFRDACRTRGIPVFVHSPYLVNLGSPTPLTLERSVSAVAHSLMRAAAVGARGVVVHTGSAVDATQRTSALRQVSASLLPLLDALGDRQGGSDGYRGPDILLEPTAGQGASLCATVDELGPYLDALGHHPRVGVCLDTCHAFAAGHDLTVPDGVDRLLRALAVAAGPGRLRLVHANDSKDPPGSRRDRHERIGAGRIGVRPFADLLAHPLVAGVPVVVETPGGMDAHRADVALLKRLRDG